MTKRSLLLAVACLVAGAALSAPIRQHVPVVRGLQFLDPGTGVVRQGQFVAGIALGSDADAPVAIITCLRVGNKIQDCALVSTENAAKEGYIVSQLP